MTGESVGSDNRADDFINDLYEGDEFDMDFSALEDSEDEEPGNEFEHEEVIEETVEEDSGSGENGEEPREVYEERGEKENEGAKNNFWKKYGKIIIPAVAIATGVAAVIGGIGISKKIAEKNKAAQNVGGNPQIEFVDPNYSEEAEEAEEEEEDAGKYAGELENGTKYDYTEYADRFIIQDDNWEEEAKSRWGEGNYKVVLDKEGKPWGVTGKEAWNAYGEDRSETYGDREATVAGMMEVAANSPEALASYVYYIFDDEEKAEVGINDITPANAKDGITMVDIDNYMSEVENEDGGELQKKCLEKLEQILNSDLTEFVFYEENDTETTNYIYYVDDNGDGNLTPDELHLGYDVRKRNGAKQFDIYRLKLAGHNKDGDYYAKTKVADINMGCGDQPNSETPPKGVKKTPGDPESAGAEGSGSAGNESAGNESAGNESAGNESAGNENPNTGNESAGNENPDTGNESAGNESAGSETGWGKEGDTHADDLVDVAPVGPKTEGYDVNDGNKGYVDDGGATPGAGSEKDGITNPERKEGGEKQDKGGTNGENPNNKNNEEGEKVDQGGNKQQQDAQDGGNTPGGNNNSDKTEEQRVAEGDF